MFPAKVCYVCFISHGNKQKKNLWLPANVHFYSVLQQLEIFTQKPHSRALIINLCISIEITQKYESKLNTVCKESEVMHLLRTSRADGLHLSEWLKAPAPLTDSAHRAVGSRACCVMRLCGLAGSHFVRCWLCPLWHVVIVVWPVGNASRLVISDHSSCGVTQLIQG